MPAVHMLAVKPQHDALHWLLNSRPPTQQTGAYTDVHTHVELQAVAEGLAGLAAAAVAVGARAASLWIGRAGGRRASTAATA